jgi:CysZ protein
MFSAAFKALGDLLSPEFRGILFKAIALTFLLFIVVFAAVEILLTTLSLVPWPWLEDAIAVAAGLGLLVLFFFLAAPVTAIFAGLFLDRIATLVEKRHYPNDAPGRDLPILLAITTSLQFAAIVLLVNLAILPAIFFGIGAIGLIVANAYLLSREYFEMAAMRHLSVEEAKELRRENSPQVLVSGFVPALLALVPIVNLVVPLYATSYFVHIFKSLKRSSARTDRYR